MSEPAEAEAEAQYASKAATGTPASTSTAHSDMPLSPKRHNVPSASINAVPSAPANPTAPVNPTAASQPPASAANLSVPRPPSSSSPATTLSTITVAAAPPSASYASASLPFSSSSSAASGYGGLAYAPRQRPPFGHRLSATFQPQHVAAASATFSRDARSNLATASSAAQDGYVGNVAGGGNSASPHLTSGASSPRLLQPPPTNVGGAGDGGDAANHAAAATASSATASLRLQKMRADAQALGIEAGSLGWALLESIRLATELPWVRLADLLYRGEATLLLPRTPAPAPGHVSLATAYDHVLLAESRRPEPPPPPRSAASPRLESDPAARAPSGGATTSAASSIRGGSGAWRAEAGGANRARHVVTLSGLRGALVDHGDNEDDDDDDEGGGSGDVEGASFVAATRTRARTRLEIASFVPREGTGFVGELMYQTSRDALLSSLAPLPRPSSEACRNPRYRLGAFRSDYRVYPAAPSLACAANGGGLEASSAGAAGGGAGGDARRPRSGSRGGLGLAAGDSERARKAANRASATFATLFGGGARDRQPQPQQQPQQQQQQQQQQNIQAKGEQEMASMGQGADGGAAASSARRRSGDSAVSGELQDMSASARAAAGAAVDSGGGTSGGGASGVGPGSSAASGGRGIAVWVTDAAVRRSEALRCVGEATEARLRGALGRERTGEDMPPAILEVILSFAAMFLPPTRARTDVAARGVRPTSSEGDLKSPSFGISHAPYLSCAEDMSDSFQDFYASIRAQLEESLVAAASERRATQPSDGGKGDVGGDRSTDAGARTAATSAATLTEKQDARATAHDAPDPARVDALVEAVETALCRELYDRLFCPPPSTTVPSMAAGAGSANDDSLHDEALASRIAALSVMGLSLGHLGVSVPADDGEGGEGRAVRQGLNAIVAACGAELQKLGSATCKSPKDKLLVLVAAHKAVVDGLATMPAIQLRDEATDTDKAGTAPRSPSVAGLALPEAADAPSSGAAEAGRGEATSASASLSPTAAAACSARPRPSPHTAGAGKSSSADLILPILIYSVVTANPPQLASHLLFIQRFRAGSLVFGEASYCLVNVQAAVAFLENVEPGALGLSGAHLPRHHAMDGEGNRPLAGGSVGRSGYLFWSSSGSGSGSSSTNDASAGQRAVQALNGPQASALSMPVRIRGRLAQEIGDLAGMSNRVITEVMGTSLYAFGRMMGASGLENFEKGRAEAPKTLDEIKSVLAGGASSGGRKALSKSSSSGNLRAPSTASSMPSSTSPTAAGFDANAGADVAGQPLGGSGATAAGSAASSKASSQQGTLSLSAPPRKPHPHMQPETHAPAAQPAAAKSASSGFARARGAPVAIASGPTDYSAPEQQLPDRELPEMPQAAAPSSTSSRSDKPSLSDRLAALPMLGRWGGAPAGAPAAAAVAAANGPAIPPTPSGASTTAGMAGAAASPLQTMRELPGPPPPQKSAEHQQRLRTYSNASASAASVQGGVGGVGVVGGGAGAGLLASPVSPHFPGYEMGVGGGGGLLSPTMAAATWGLNNLPASLQSPYPPLPRPPTEQRPLHVVLASTGSVASVKVPLIVEALLSYANVRVQVVATDASLHFFDADSIERLDRRYGGRDFAEGGARGADVDGGAADEADSEPRYTVADLAAENRAASRGGAGSTSMTSGAVHDEATTEPPSPSPLSSPSATSPTTAAGGGRGAARRRGGARLPRAHLWRDADEWSTWRQVGDAILHIELRRWADVVLVAPCSANTLAKISSGICDTLLTSLLRALSPRTPTLLFPAMNTLMYLHPLTSRQVHFAREVLGYEVVGPIAKRLACGDVGVGAMAEWQDVVSLVVARFGLVVATPTPTATTTTTTTTLAASTDAGARSAA